VVAETFVCRLTPCVLRNIVVSLTVTSIRIGLLSSKIHNGDDTPKESLPSSSDVNNE